MTDTTIAPAAAAAPPAAPKKPSLRKRLPKFSVLFAAVWVIGLTILKIGRAHV